MNRLTFRANAEGILEIAFELLEIASKILEAGVIHVRGCLQS